MRGPYGFTHGEYLPTLIVGNLHVYTDCRLIARESYRRMRLKKFLRANKRFMVNGRIPRDLIKEAIRARIAEHLANRQLFRDVMRGTPSGV